ncbi:MAG TPA: Sua5 family C-terminal domain-containing protein, partial [Devosiaceae bacterium]|nr:Sua5 family C-terminal domain-containing protein [Devosiaceae bacterium]
ALGGAVPVLDGGRCAAGLESTIVAIRGDTLTLLRPGAVPRADIEAVAGVPVADPAPDGGVSAPGMLARHYAPKTPLRLGATGVLPGEALLAFGPDVPAAPGPVRNLSPAGDLREAARNLFADLSALDASGATAIAVMPIPKTGLGEAINDRLKRAATR